MSFSMLLTMNVLVEIKRILMKSRLVRGFLYSYSTKRVLSRCVYYEQNESLRPDIQKAYLYELLCYAKNHTQYFYNLIPEALNRSNGIEVLKNLPFLTKDIIREQGERIFSDELKTKNHGWANTGGSTGEPLRFPTLFSNHNMEPICQMMLYHMMGVNGATDLIVSIDGTRIGQGDIDNNIYWKTELVNFPYGKYSMSTLYMSENTMPYYIKFLNQVKPKAMRGYPSGFMELATYCKKYNLSFNFCPKGIYLTSENFGSKEESLISEVFGCPVWGQYGHTESSVFAVKRPCENTYLCSPIYGYTEILDENGLHVKEGQVGEIVVTGFNHYGLPFIRYKTGDLAEYGGTHVNGSVVLNKLLGRSIDYLINREGDKIFLVGFIFGGHLKAFNHIKQWQLEQFEKGTVIMTIVQGVGYDNQIEKEISNLFASKLLTVNIAYTDHIEKTGRGKMKFLIQHLN